MSLYAVKAIQQNNIDGFLKLFRDKDLQVYCDGRVCIVSPDGCLHPCSQLHLLRRVFFIFSCMRVQWDSSPIA
jgi:hypothetical protein